MKGRTNRFEPAATIATPLQIAPMAQARARLLLLLQLFPTLI